MPAQGRKVTVGRVVSRATVEFQDLKAFQEIQDYKVCRDPRGLVARASLEIPDSPGILDCRV